jgi:hypothetical protein
VSVDAEGTGPWLSFWTVDMFFLCALYDVAILRSCLLGSRLIQLCIHIEDLTRNIAVLTNRNPDVKFLHGPSYTLSYLICLPWVKSSICHLYTP